mmetsp:Transcript_2738/g.6135  ORF Transcript_2738/g.6135 Transcript_2738/m.6135 type:complete len:216 (+) Transcript_2738:1214-1861(+)
MSKPSLSPPLSPPALPPPPTFSTPSAEPSRKEALLEARFRSARYFSNRSLKLSLYLLVANRQYNASAALTHNGVSAKRSISSHAAASDNIVPPMQDNMILNPTAASTFPESISAKSASLLSTPPSMRGSLALGGESFGGAALPADNVLANGAEGVLPTPLAPAPATFAPLPEPPLASFGDLRGDKPPAETPSVMARVSTPSPPLLPETTVAPATP